MAGSDFSEVLAAANAPLTDPGMNRIVGTGEPRYELYHFALSLCSQKVRTCLAEIGASYVAHDINLQMPMLGNYDPAYVRLRMQGGAGRELVRGYTGRSSVETEGFDPAVVPTLVDLEAQIVTVDSAVICRKIDADSGNNRQIVPVEKATEIKAEVATVDRTQHVAVFYGAHPDIDFRPERIRKFMPGVHDRKIEKIRKARSLVTGDPALVAALDAKIAKERAGKQFVAAPEAMRQAVSETVTIIAELDRRLSDGRIWITGDTFTLADIFWAVSLFRLKWLGMAFCWQGGHQLNDKPRPFAASYAALLFERPSFRNAVIHWPGIGRTEYVAEHYDD